jgi:V8-like Glu-specific endopeptidase
VALVVFQEDLVQDEASPGYVELVTEPYGEYLNLCASERFFDQPMYPGACTAFLVSPDLVVTAGHCVTAANVTRRRFAFGFAMYANVDVIRTRFGLAWIGEGAELVARVATAEGADWAVVRLARPMSNRFVEPASRRTSPVSEGEPLYVLGHPNGLPMKYATGSVRDTSHEHYIVTNLDTYGGNSGSPVFDRNQQVVGILIRGEEDFEVTEEGCRRSMYYSDQDGRGEHVQRIQALAQYLP